MRDKLRAIVSLKKVCEVHSRQDQRADIWSIATGTIIPNTISMSLGPIDEISTKTRSIESTHDFKYIHE